MTLMSGAPADFIDLLCCWVSDVVKNPHIQIFLNFLQQHTSYEALQATSGLLVLLIMSVWWMSMTQYDETLHQSCVCSAVGEAS